MNMEASTQKTLRLILGDQLNIHHSWFQHVDDSIAYVMMEVKSETSTARYHIQKVMGVFAAMRQFANELKRRNHRVIYIHIHDEYNTHQFDKNCHALIDTHVFTKFEYQLPDEYRVDQHLMKFTSQLSIPSSSIDTEHFYSSRYELKEFFSGKKMLLMESFYRGMRQKHQVLVDEQKQPLHGKWNFDEENRKKLPKNHTIPAPFLFSNNLKNIEDEITSAGIETIGSVDSGNFFWPINGEQSLQLLDHFLEYCLPLFGSFQDAMTTDDWSIYHSRLSFSMNVKLLSPSLVVNKAIEAYQKRPNDIAFHQLEGFVRQIIGWREYMRGIYWMHMPEFSTLNYFGYTRQLPSWYWTGETKMHCMSHAICQSLEYAYAHHIQRLMVTGNFALLAGIHPDEVDEWYLGIYMDAFQWVEITNTRGMSQFADGGIVGTKPYVSSAAYIHKMSNYCSGCYYDKDKKVGDKACPFNSLYWNFYHTHEDKLSNNPRIGMVYHLWNKMTVVNKESLLVQANYYLENINDL